MYKAFTPPTASPLVPPYKLLPTSKNPQMRRLLQHLARVAGSQATVLIRGESGTGKGVLAEAIHAGSRRRRRPFVRLNCAALPDNLLESELFGHERGAFTGALRQHCGRFERADGGTLFIDEIGAAAPKVQLRLLRVLQEKAFERLGGQDTLRVDVRVIAATNADLGAEVEAGRFRADLFYRLNVVPLTLPPLRQRREDIPDLVDLCIRRAATRNQRPVDGLAPETLDILRDYPWPGNIRQLENVVEHMVVLAAGPVLQPDAVPDAVRHWRRDLVVKEGDLPFREARLRFERRFLCDSLRRHKGIIAQVAEAIGMSRKNLYTKLENLQIPVDEYRS